MPEIIQSLFPWLGPPWSIQAAAVVIAVSAAFLALGADWTVEASIDVADRLGVSPQLIGLTLVAMGTSAPEFAVSITAAVEEGSTMAISNVVGSNIFNLGFILGSVALVSPLQTDGRTVWRDGTVLLMSAVAVWLLFGIDLGVDRSNGALLLLGLVGYLALLLWGARSEHKEVPAREGARAGWVVAVRLVVGILFVVVSAELLVEAASSIAYALGLSEWVIGITIVAAGTSLPELTTSLVAVVRGQHGLSLGNLIGSDIFNVLGVLGVTALLQPVPIGSEASGSILALVGMVCLTLIFMRTGWRISRLEGSALVALGLLRWVLDFTQ